MLVHRVTGLTVFSLPLVFVKTWLVIARGETATMGWTNARLTRESDDGSLASLSFEADEPSDITLPVMTPIVTSTLLQPVAGMRGVRVQGKSNAIVNWATLYQAAGSGAEEEGEHDFSVYESEYNDFGYEPEDADQLRSSFFSVDSMESIDGTHCDRRRLFKVISRIEFKMKGLKLYRRERYLTTFLKFCYPTDIGDQAVEAIRNCLPAAIVAGVAAAAGGPGAAAAAFMAAMKSCAGAELGSKVMVKIETKEEIGAWHRA